MKIYTNLIIIYLLFVAPSRGATFLEKVDEYHGYDLADVCDFIAARYLEAYTMLTDYPNIIERSKLLHNASSDFAIYEFEERGIIIWWTTSPNRKFLIVQSCFDGNILFDNIASHLLRRFNVTGQKTPINFSCDKSDMKVNINGGRVENIFINSYID